jgi:hypothetical protein
MCTDFYRRAYRRIVDRNAYADAGTGNRYPDSDANAICDYEPDHYAHANSNSHAEARADTSPPQVCQLCAVASLARF